MGGKMFRVNALIDEDRKKAIFHALIDEGISYSEWTRRMIDKYLAEKEPKDDRVRVLADRRREKRLTDTQNATGKPKSKGRKGKEG